MDEEEDGVSIGARPKERKVPNPLNQPRRDREARQREQLDAQQQEAEGEQAQPGGRGRGRGQRGRGPAHQQEGRGQHQQVEGEQAQPGGRGQGQRGRGQAHQQGGRGQHQQVEGGEDEGILQQVEGGEDEEILPQSKLPAFGDNSQIYIDWTTTGLFGDAIDQREDTCGSVVFTRLTQAAYNKDRPIPEHRELSYQHLANHIQSVTGKKGSFSFRNLNIPKNFIKVEGLHTEGHTSGKGVKTKVVFDSLRDADARTIFERLETVPLGIVLDDVAGLHEVGMDIYEVPGQRLANFEHALLALAKGRTLEGVDFIVAQNSWGRGYGNNGYCRLSLPESRGFDIYWPRW